MSGAGAVVSCSTPQSLAESKAAHTASLTILAVGPAVASIFVALRIWSRSLMRTFGWDDWLIVAALLLSIAQSAVGWLFAEASFAGYHACDVPTMTIAGVKTLQQRLLAQQLVYNPILALVKASVLVFLLHFQDKRWYIHRTLQVFFVVNVALSIAIFLADLFQCTPVRYMYDFITMDIEAALAAGANPATGMTPDGRIIKGGKCIQQTAFVLSTAAIVTFTEALTLLIPMLMVWNLQIARRKKLAVITILSLGWIVVAASIARIVLFSRLLSPDPGDSSYGAQNQMSTIEINLAIIVACAPALKALTTRLLPRFLSSRGASSYYFPPNKRGAAQKYNQSSTYGHSASGSNGQNIRRARLSQFGGRSGGGRDQYDIGTFGLDTFVEKTESQERIMTPSARNTVRVEKTVHIDIEMSDLEPMSSRSPVNPEGKRKGGSKASSMDWPRI